LWDHKLASELSRLEQIFAEVVDRNARVADNGKILDSRGRVVKDYGEAGLPAYMEVHVPADSDYFTLEVNGQRIHQPLRDGARIRRPGGAAGPPPPTEPPKPTKEPPKPVREMPKQAAAPEPIMDALPVVDDPGADEWKSLPLEFGKEDKEKPDVDLDQHKD